jgi:C1A family cysteine protease
MKICLLFLVVVSVTLCQDSYTFEQFITDFGKSYHSEEEYAYRRNIFDTNYRAIQESNKQQKDYILGPNQFTDLSDEEKQTFLKAPIDTKIIPSAMTPTPKVRAVPGEWDWRHYSKVTPVKVQGTCGSCWVFSSVAAFESLLLIKTGQSYDLSEEYVLECAGPHSNCWGGFVSDANSLIIGRGVPL